MSRCLSRAPPSTGFAASTTDPVSRGGATRNADKRPISRLPSDLAER